MYKVLLVKHLYVNYILYNYNYCFQCVLVKHLYKSLLLDKILDYPQQVFSSLISKERFRKTKSYMSGYNLNIKILNLLS